MIPARLTLASAALLAAPTPALADSAFTTEQAARCGVVFARMADALAGNAEAPDQLVTQVAIGLPIWEYELIASAPGRDDVLEAAVKTAIDDLLAGMPGGEDEASARGDYLLTQAQSCGQLIDAAYPDAQHPIVTEIRAQQAARAGAVPVPSPRPDRAADTEPRRRGLR